MRRCVVNLVDDDAAVLDTLTAGGLRSQSEVTRTAWRVLHLIQRAAADDAVIVDVAGDQILVRPKGADVYQVVWP